VAKKSPFVQLLEAVHAVEGLERIRFVSPHPIGFRDDLVQAFVDLPKLCSHIHFPMQSGSDRILQLMKRPYRHERFMEICRNMKKARPDLAITTDIIVGFPTETEEDFLASLETVKEVEFANAFIFRYSKRRNTPAAEMEGQIEETVKEERNQRLLAVVNEICQRQHAELVGTTQRILCEGLSRYNDERLSGRTSQNRIVVFEGDVEKCIGQMLDIKITGTTGFTLYGEKMAQ
jgi:tRNA-2-methylthio-N6-dimethylallyladenosine synthase